MNRRNTAQVVCASAPVVCSYSLGLLCHSGRIRWANKLHEFRVDTPAVPTPETAAYLPKRLPIIIVQTPKRRQKRKKKEENTIPEKASGGPDEPASPLDLIGGGRRRRRARRSATAASSSHDRVRALAHRRQLLFSLARQFVSIYSLARSDLSQRDEEILTLSSLRKQRPPVLWCQAPSGLTSRHFCRTRFWLLLCKLVEIVGIWRRSKSDVS